MIAQLLPAVVIVILAAALLFVYGAMCSWRAMAIEREETAWEEEALFWRHKFADEKRELQSLCATKMQVDFEKEQ